MAKTNNVTVLKIGGSLLNPDKFPQLLKGLAPSLRKTPTVIVHGGGKEVTALCEKLGIETRFVNGRRFTDEATMEVVEMTLAGKVNPYIVDRLNGLGVKAFGLSGRNARLVEAKPLTELGRVGLPSRINAAAIQTLIKQGYTPVFSSIAADGKGGALNINADDMASALAVALKAKRLILFTDVPGVLDDRKETIPHINAQDAKKLVVQQIITGGMIPKIESSFESLKKGVGEIWILEGALPLNAARGTVLMQKTVKTKHPFAGLKDGGSRRAPGRPFC